MKTALITGGSSGIGYEISRHFARAGYRLLWVAKPPEELKAAARRIQAEFPELEVQTLALDLTSPDAALQVQAWASGMGSVEVLINNAGFGTYGFTDTVDLEKDIRMIQLHVLTLYHLTRLFLDEMIDRQAGTIINISSISALQPVPRMNTYASTKAFVKHFSQGLQQELELQRSPVRVMTVCPAAIRDTPFQAAAQMEGVKTFSGLAFTTAEEVAADVWKGFVRGKTLVVSGAKMRFLYALRGLMPLALQRYLVRKETERAKA